MFGNHHGAVAIFVALCLLIASAATARAASFADALAPFANASFSDTEAAIGAVAASGHAMAAKVIGALHQGNLLFDGPSKRIVIKDGANLIDAATGERVSEPAANFSPVRLNN